MWTDERIAAARKPMERPFVIPISRPWVVVYGRYHQAYAIAFTSQRKALQWSLDQHGNGELVPVAIVKDGTMDFWWWDVLDRPTMDSDIGFAIGMCTSVGVHVKRVGVELPPRLPGTDN